MLRCGNPFRLKLIPVQATQFHVLRAGKEYSAAQRCRSSGDFFCVRHYWVCKTQSSLVFAEVTGTGGTVCFLLSVCCSLLPTDEKCYCSSCSWVQCWVICLKCITCVTRILLDDLIVPFTLKLCEIRQYISLNVAAVWQTELKRF